MNNMPNIQWPDDMGTLFASLSFCEEIPTQRASKIGLCCFHCCKPEQTAYFSHMKNERKYKNLGGIKSTL